MQIRNVRQIWDYLGSFWDKFSLEDKETLSKFWDAYLNLANTLKKELAEANFTKYLETLIPIKETKFVDYVLDYYLRVSGLYAVEVPGILHSIPTLSGIHNNQVLIENTDYEIVQHRYIKFLTEPDVDDENSAVASFYAPTVYKHNELLWNIYASGIGMSIDDYDNSTYYTYVSGISQAQYYKYLIWNLVESKKAAPTISNLEKYYSIKAGVPFTIASGQVTYVSPSENICTIGNYTYVAPEGITFTVEEGEEINKFELISDGVRVYDWINNLDLIISQEDANTFNYKSKIVIDTPTQYITTE